MTDEIAEIWQQTLLILEKELPTHSYKIWIKTSHPISMDENQFILEVANEFAKDFIGTRYAALIQNTIRYITKQELKLVLTVPINDTSLEPAAATATTIPATASNSNHVQPVTTTVAHDENLVPKLNPKYTFETFVIGNSNRFVHAASLAVADSPAKAYNPLFIYGGVGLGKTHLMHAIGHHVLLKNPNQKVLYVSSEKFTNELIDSIKNQQTTEFRNLYRNIDILMVDDIQFLAKKEATQEEFFHTFNTLYEANKQIIISSDRPPKEIPTLEDRLRSRFEWGLIADIQPPDIETRIAILRKKANVEQLNIPDEVMITIASRIESNIRELEGALIRVVAYSSLINKDISVELVEEALKDILPANHNRPISIRDIQQFIANYYNLRPEELNAKKRTQNVVFPRQVAMYLCRELTDESLPRIGQEFGGRDHTTVIHAYEKILKEKNSDFRFGQILKEIAKKIQNQS